MGRDLRVGVISPYRCHVFDDSRPEQSSSFSDVVASSANAPDPANVGVMVEYFKVCAHAPPVEALIGLGWYLEDKNRFVQSTTTPAS
ncbi:hypothetical protein SprV_0100098900 [Sparganum proliferum]